MVACCLRSNTRSCYDYLLTKGASTFFASKDRPDGGDIESACSLQEVRKEQLVQDKHRPAEIWPGMLSPMLELI